MIATTVEQSKKLVELGIDPDTADMYYMFHRDDGRIVAPFPYVKDGNENTGEDRLFDYLPAWSLSALMELMPSEIDDNYFLSLGKEDYKDGSVYYCCYEDCNGNNYHSFHGSTAIDTVLKMIKWLKENDKDL